MEQVIQAALNEYVIPSLVTALGSLAVYALGLASQWLKSKVHDARFHCATDKLTHLAQQAVLEQEQIAVKQLKLDGKWNLEGQEKVKARAREVMERHLGPRGLKELQGCLGHKGKEGVSVIQGMLDSAIEAAIAMNQSGQVLISKG